MELFNDLFIFEMANNHQGDVSHGISIIKEMGKIATVGLAAAVFGPLMNITGSALASWWHNRLPKEFTNETVHK